MYSDELFKEMLNANAEVKNLFFTELDCDDCPCLREECAGRSCAESIKLHYSECTETNSEKNESTTEKEESNIEKNEPAAPEEEEMSMRELTNLRREINRKYIKARNKAFTEMVEEMYKTGKFYTAEDLSDMSGLSINTISKIFRYYRNYNNNLFFGGYRFETKKTWLRTPFVRLLPTGEVDMSRQIDQCREVLSYKIVKR
jgi:hypothetical protein